MISLPARYKPVKELAGGGMSETWQCIDTNLQRNVVVKSIKPGIAKAKLLDELGALSAIRSKHVVQVLDVIRDQHGEIFAFVEEFIDGTSLTADPVADPAKAMRMIYPIACGVADIHAHKRVHRDLKPDNMKVDGEGTLKVLDFGLAKPETSDGTSVLFYTPGFAAPEAFQKNAKGAHEYSYPIDVFAFGATALWLLNEGKLPPEFFTLPSTVPAGCFDFGKLPCGLAAPVSAILNATLAANPSERPTMREVRDMLMRHLLQDRHRMLLTLGGKDYWIDASKRSSTLEFAGSSITIHYDGLDFKATAVNGFIQINNKQAVIGTILTGAAVIVLNGTNGTRASITADVSHPEVMT